MQYLYSVSCTQDDTDGHIQVTNEVHLDEGCGTNATNHPKDHNIWLVDLAPNPTGSTPFTASSSLSSCFDTCSDNDAEYEYTFTSEMPPPPPPAPGP